MTFPPLTLVPPIKPSATPISRSKEAIEKFAKSNVGVFPDIPNEGPAYNFGVIGGKTALILGTAEHRTVEGIFWAYSQQATRMRFQRYPATFRLEFGIDYGHGGGAVTSAGTFPHDDRVGVYMLPTIRWRGRPRNHIGLLFGMGLGLYFSDPSPDLSSPISTMPTIDIGIYDNSGRDEWQLFLRWRHASNAGTKLPNDGQNLFEIGLGYRYGQ